MKYMGSKKDVAQDILPLILSGRKEGQLYVEPFVGGANSFDKVENPRLGADNNHYLIACLAAVRDGWIPPDVVTEDEYKAIKAEKDMHPPELVGFVGFGCAFGSDWFGTYAKGERTSVLGYRTDGSWGRILKHQNYARQARDLLIEQAPRLRGATFVHSDYQRLSIPDGSIVYCDPPYAGTRLYHSGAFDHIAFWAWATDLSQRCRVFVSEYAAPDGWECVWRRDQTTNINNHRGKAFKASEALFVPTHQLRRLL